MKFSPFLLQSGVPEARLLLQKKELMDPNPQESFLRPDSSSESTMVGHHQFSLMVTLLKVYLGRE